MRFCMGDQAGVARPWLRRGDEGDAERGAEAVQVYLRENYVRRRSHAGRDAGWVPIITLGSLPAKQVAVLAETVCGALPGVDQDQRKRVLFGISVVSQRELQESANAY